MRERILALVEQMKMEDEEVVLVDNDVDDSAEEGGPNLEAVKETINL
jgi:hypothetical protein